MAITKITKNIPTLIPAWKISPMASHEVNDSNTVRSKAILKMKFFININFFNYWLTDKYNSKIQIF